MCKLMQRCGSSTTLRMSYKASGTTVCNAISTATIYGTCSGMFSHVYCLSAISGNRNTIHCRIKNVV